jgi:hypothetical protein
VSAYPDRAHEASDKVTTRRALKALDEIEAEVAILRRRIANGTVEGESTQILADRAREVTQHVSVLEALRTVREWSAGTTVEGIAVWDAVTGDGAPVVKIAPGGITFVTEDGGDES